MIYYICIFQLQLQVASSVSLDLVNRVLFISMKHLTDFAKQYKEAVNRYAKAHFDNRTLNFTPNMIAISNNCTGLMINARKFQDAYKKDDNNQNKMDRAFAAVIESFGRLKHERFVHTLL